MKFGEQVVKSRYFILLIFIILLVLACALIPRMLNRVNYDLTSYLPEHYNTTDGYQFLSKKFNIYGDIEIGVKTNNKDALKDVTIKIKELEGVSMLIWAGDISSILEFGLVDEEDEQYKHMYSLFSDGNNWLILITLKYAPSSMEALSSYNQIIEILNNNPSTNNNYCTSGMTEQASSLFANTIDEFWKYALIAVAFVILILVLTTNSLTEPIVLLLTILISIVINLGTNALFPSTSIITFACTAILQLGLTMDYAIFLLHQYRAELKNTLEPKQALINSIPIATKAILASALTTIGGLLALTVMKFRVGPDLGISVAKGIVLSFLTVILLQPCLMLMLEKLRVKTQHKCLDLKYRPVVKHSIKNRLWLILIFIPIFIFALLVNVSSMPWSLKYTYVHFTKDKEIADDLKQVNSMATQMSNQVMIAVPLYMQTEDGMVYYIDQQYELVDELNKIKASEDIAFSLGLFTMLDKDTSINMKEILGLDITIGIEDLIPILVEHQDLIPQEYSDKLTLVNSYFRNGYTIYTIGINTKYDVESKECFAILDKVYKIVSNIFSKYNKIYMTGYTQAAYDFAKVTPTDNAWVSIITIIIIFVILLFTLRSIKFSTALVAVIEFGIWINLLLQWLFYDGTINFMSYMFIGAVQLGATVDYAILIATKYKSLRKKYEPRQAAYVATTQSAMAISTSALIMGTACGSVALVTSNLVVQELCGLIARGAVISAILVIVLLPAILVSIDKHRGDELHVPRTPKLRKFKIKFKKK